MNQRPAALLLLVVVACVGAAPAPPIAPEVQAPLLFVRVSGPAGMSVTFLEGRNGRSFDAPVSVGMRPGFIYRLRLEGMKSEPNLVLYPSIEVWGTLRLPPTLRAADYPTPLMFAEADLERAAGGTLVTKVILLEDPDKAVAAAQPEGLPTEVDVAAHEDPVAYAKTQGRPLLVVRIGQREPEPKELARLRAGMILYPGDKALPPLTTFPDLPPTLDLRPLFRPPEECLRDGGDHGPPAHLTPGGQLQGLDPADSVAEYTDSRGRRKVAVTNPICICVPRFLAVRHLFNVAAMEGMRETGRMDGHEAYNQFDARQDARLKRQVEDPEMLRARQRLSAAVSVTPKLQLVSLDELHRVEMELGPASFLGSEKMITLSEQQRLQLRRQVQLAREFSKLVGPNNATGREYEVRAIGSMAGVGQVSGSLETCEVVYLCEHGKPEVPEQPLQVLKWASTHSAQIGDVVTFYIRYSNCGGKPIENIAVSDSLTARLEYIPGSAKSDREAIFVTQVNEAGSLILRWEIRDPLPTGQRGVVSFQARIK